MGRPSQTVEVPCTACGVSITRQPAQLARNATGRFFCSRACQDRLGSKPRSIPDRACDECGTMFHPPQRANVGRFCSKACHDVWQRRHRVTRTCETCGKAFGTKRSENAKSNHGVRFCSKACQGIGQTTRGTGREHNGRGVTINRQGYCLVYEPGFPGSSASNGRALEHRVVAAQRLGRPLLPTEQVHHINGVKTDNRSENLAVLDPAAHTLITLSEAGLRRASAQRRIRELEAEVAEYRRRFGALT